MLDYAGGDQSFVLLEFMCGVFCFVLEYDLFHGMRFLARAALLCHFARGTRSIERGGYILSIGIMYGQLSHEDALPDFFVGLNLLWKNIYQHPL